MSKEKVMTTKKDNLPTAINLEQMAGQGQEFVTARDQKLPILKILYACLLYTSPSPRDGLLSRMPSSA